MLAHYVAALATVQIAVFNILRGAASATRQRIVRAFLDLAAEPAES